jgi:hypothetical protein
VSTTERPVWRISPFVRPLRRIIDDDGACALPDDVPHCHGAEIQHDDGLAECWPAIGDEVCESPGSGRHGFIHFCERASRARYAHRCQRCR